MKVNHQMDETGHKAAKERLFGFSITLKLPTIFFRRAAFPSVLLLLLAGISTSAQSTNGPFSIFGPAYSKYRMVLDQMEKSEALGPLLAWEENDRQKMFAVPPLFSIYKDEGIPQLEFELAYPILSLDKFGSEYRLQFFQVINWSGGKAIKDDSEKRRFTLFPFYFQQRSPNPEENYTAVLPFYGHLKNRVFRDEIFFVMLPLYLETKKREVVTYNYVFPIFHLREGPGLKGWQFWPIVGKEHKEPTTSTNVWGDVAVVGGHDKFFALWPFYFNNTLGIGTTNVQKQFVLLPFYTSQVASNRVSKSYGFPIGYTHTIDYERKYEEWDAPWPLVVFARGEGKRTDRVWPLFGKASTPVLRSDFYLWPVYKYNRATAEPLDRERTRIMLFLYSDIKERNTTNNTMLHRIDFWPFFTWRKDREDNVRMQALSILEPLLPNNKSIERLYSPVYALWRQEKNARTGEQSKSLLWNLYRYEKRREETRHSAFFGAFEKRKGRDKTRWKLFWIPFSTRGQSANPLNTEEK